MREDILNQLINTRYIQGVFYSFYHVTRELYSAQIGVNMRLAWNMVKGTSTENSHALENINRIAWKNKVRRKDLERQNVMQRKRL